MLGWTSTGIFLGPFRPAILTLEATLNRYWPYKLIEGDSEAQLAHLQKVKRSALNLSGIGWYWSGLGEGLETGFNPLWTSSGSFSLIAVSSETRGLEFPRGLAQRKGKGGLTEFSCLLQ
jgi:hypothetical protein